MNVYLVSRGEYSDFHIEAVFSGREAADRYVAVRKECDTYDIGYHIHEHEVDAAGKVGAVAIATYSVTINLSTGMIEDLEQDCEEVGSPSARGRVHSPELHYDARGELLDNSLIFATSYVSPGHARKLAVEARQKWLMKKAQWSIEQVRMQFGKHDSLAPRAGRK